MTIYALGPSSNEHLGYANTVVTKCDKLRLYLFLTFDSSSSSLSGCHGYRGTRLIIIVVSMVLDTRGN